MKQNETCEISSNNSTSWFELWFWANCECKWMDLTMLLLCALLVFAFFAAARLEKCFSSHQAIWALQRWVSSHERFIHWRVGTVLRAVFSRLRADL
jgi:hypothetical protein